MGRHLKMENWFRRTSTQTWQRRRVSAVAEKFFPKAERELLQREGPAALVKAYLTANPTWELAQAWECVKTKVNTQPGKVTQPFLS